MSIIPNKEKEKLPPIPPPGSKIFARAMGVKVKNNKTVVNTETRVFNPTPPSRRSLITVKKACQPTKDTWATHGQDY
jgi:hypothetical protein